jgi:hypothetical protein
LSLFAILPHYSASNLNQPNLGINAFAIETTIRYLRRQTVAGLDNETPKFSVLNKKVKPFFRLSYGINRIG